MAQANTSTETCETRIEAALANERDTFRTYMHDPKVNEEGNDELPAFHQYGLSFDFVDAGTFDDQETGFYRYQLSWGGPSDELRFHRDGSVEYRFHDWFDGAGRMVTSEDWAQRLAEFFRDCGMINWDAAGNKECDTPSVGTIIQGTLRLEDLIPCFMDETRLRLIALNECTNGIKLADYARVGVLWGSYHRLVDLWFELDPNSWLHGKGNIAQDKVEEAQHMLDDLFDLLNELAPEGYYFGSHPGDGADFGYWPALDC